MTGIVKSIRDFVDADSKKFGGRQPAAMFRSGFKEVGQIFPALSDSIGVEEEYGLMGNLLPSEIAQKNDGPSKGVEHNMELER